ncbi:hypothetical protein BBJ28_00010763 [Nothophytophthora sp. Chile5]|nr:hypothetical protein BBJ28_00010763 [Nothophytophthora sp. Chile5]
MLRLSNAVAWEVRRDLLARQRALLLESELSRSRREAECVVRAEAQTEVHVVSEVRKVLRNAMHRKLNEHVGLLKQEDTTLRLVAAKSSSALKEEATKRLIAEQRGLARSEAIATFRAVDPVQNASNTKACLICQANEDCSRSELDEEFRLANVMRALEAGEGMDSTNSNNWTALMLAASRGRVEVVQLLLECHANVDLVATNSKPLRSMTFVFLLLLGLETGDLFFIVIIGGIVGLLSTLAKPDHGWTALTFAAYCQLRVTQLLLDHGAVVDLRDDNGYTASGRLLPESATNVEVETSDAPVPAIPEWFIPEEAVQKQPKPFNAGTYGKVFRGTWRGSKVVVKCVEATSVEEKRTFLREAKILYKLRHPHIVTFFGACHTSRPCFFVCEEAANGNLADYLAKMEAAGRSLVWQKLHEAALGLLFLHQNGIVHGDLKCNQILVNGDGVAKLTDFGMSFASSDSRPANSDTNVRWAAPECLTSEGLPPTCESDVFSFGMSVVEAVTNNVPWGVYLADDIIQNHLVHHRFLSKPAAFESDAHWQLVLDLCAFEPSRRLKLSTAIDRLQQFAEATFLDGGGFKSTWLPV